MIYSCWGFFFPFHKVIRYPSFCLLRMSHRHSLCSQLDKQMNTTYCQHLNISLNTDDFFLDLRSWLSNVSFWLRNSLNEKHASFFVYYRYLFIIFINY